MSIAIYGFPTTGKSYAAKMLRRKGYRVLDSDQFYDPKSHCTPLELVERAYEEGRFDVFITNLKPTELPEVDFNFKFVRLEPDVVHELSLARGDSNPISVELAQCWMEGLFKVKGTINLSRDQYIWDVIGNCFKTKESIE